MTTTLSMHALSLALLATACATGVNHPGTDSARHYAAVSVETDTQVYRETGVPAEDSTQAKRKDSTQLSLLERLYPVHPPSAVHGIHEQPITP